MTEFEKIVVSAYTGYLLCDSFDPVHEYIEKLLGRPVYTHELGTKSFLYDEIRELARPDLEKICGRREPMIIAICGIPEFEDLILEERKRLIGLGYTVDSLDKAKALYVVDKGCHTNEEIDSFISYAKQIGKIIYRYSRGDLK